MTNKPSTTKAMETYHGHVHAFAMALAVGQCLNETPESAAQKVAAIPPANALDMLMWAQEAYRRLPLLMSMLAARAEGEDADPAPTWENFIHKAYMDSLSLSDDEWHELNLVVHKDDAAEGDA